MRLYRLLQTISGRWQTPHPDPEISGLFYDSRLVEPGGLFFALRGAQVDGHRFIAQAVDRGAVAVVVEEEVSLPAGVAGFLVENARQAMALAAAAFYRDPTADMTVIGITGTNGKTTTTYLLESVLRAAGRRPAVFGTIDYRFEGRHLPSQHTTPESVDLLRAIAEFRQAGADALIMEASSHALEQHRVDGIRFDVGVFTNLTPEHLDYHRDMENYFAGKRRLFTMLEQSGGKAVVNVDDAYGVRLAGELQQVITCGADPRAQVHPEKVELSLRGIAGDLVTPGGRLPLNSPLLGQFNLQNLLGAAAAGLALGLAPATVAAGLAQAPQAPGRLERIENDRGALVLVDYAHTGDALENVLATMTQLSPRRLITVFGCGGDRDSGKRPVMGEIAARFSDLALITSDNPRTEDPLAILEEVRGGVERVHSRAWSAEEAARIPGRGYLIIPDRRQAIEFAASLLQADDLLLVAGKGHEDYQIIGRERRHFDDREELRRALTRAEATR
ncbi:MAG: UDP-N-acetylmuramoyl-L-alanyl-D-glutamate--2,6-diaminopimelate ligase [Desulfuromonadales bacterium]